MRTLNHQLSTIISINLLTVWLALASQLCAQSVSVSSIKVANLRVANPSVAFVSQNRSNPQDNQTIAATGNRITWQKGNAALTPTAVNSARFYIVNTYSNWGSGFPNGELSGRFNEDAVTMRAAVYTSSVGSNLPLTFNGGQSSATLNEGEGIWTDPMTVQLPATGWYIRTEFVTTVSNQRVPVSGGGYSSPEAGVIGSDVVYQSAFSLVDNNDNPRLHYPFAVAGDPVSPPDAKFQSHRFSGVGDSITEGGGTFLSVLQEANLAYCWTAQAGHRGSDYGSRPSEYIAARKAIVFNAPTLIWAFGANDLQAARTFAQLKADLQTIAADFKASGGKRLLVATVCPLTSSTDGWMTVGNQTELAAPHWADFNNWARTATSAELSNLEVVVVDIAAAAAEPGTNKWKAGYTNDGVHPNSGTGFPAIRSAIKDGVIAALKADF